MLVKLVFKYVPLIGMAPLPREIWSHLSAQLSQLSPNCICIPKLLNSSGSSSGALYLSSGVGERILPCRWCLRWRLFSSAVARCVGCGAAVAV